MFCPNYRYNKMFVLWISFFKGRNEFSWISPFLKKRLFMKTRYLIQCETNWFKSRWNWIGKRETVLRKIKRVVVQSPYQAHLNLLFVQSCYTSQVFYHYVTALLRQHPIILHVVQILWNDKVWFPRHSHDNQ